MQEDHFVGHIGYTSHLPVPREDTIPSSGDPRQSCCQDGSLDRGRGTSSCRANVAQHDNYFELGRLLLLDNPLHKGQSHFDSVDGACRVQPPWMVPCTLI
jgi:hypothetical protein